MKKVFFSVLSIAVVAGTITSCGKTTKGKMDNEWNVTSINTSSYDEDGDGWSQKISSSSVVKTTVSNNNSETKTIATVNSNTMTISKDGTWKKVYDYTTVDYDTTSVGTFEQYTKTTTNKVETRSGTWGFESKNKTEEFKKNERVVFNITKSNTVTKSTMESSSSIDPTVNTTGNTNNDTDTYSTGQAVTIYVVKESTAKKLVLTADTDYTNVNSSTPTGGSTTTSNSSDKSTFEMTLEQK